MRIALFTDTYPPTVNGVSRALGLLVEHAVRAGHEVALVTPGGSAEYASEVALHVRLPGPPFPLYPELRACAPFLGPASARLVEFAPDVVHAATEAGVGLAGRRWARRHRVPLVTSFNTLFPEYLASYRLGFLEGALWAYLRWFHRAAHLTVTPSDWMRQELAAKGFHGRTGIWSRGVDTELFHPSRRSWKLRREIAPDAEVVLMYVGRIATEKRVDLLVDAFPEIRARCQRKVGLVLVGDGPATEALRARAGEGVHFTGYRRGAELATHYASADLFVFPSDTETFGQVVTEAQASGLPAVVPDRGGVVDTVTPCRTGWRFSPGDRASLVRAVTRLVDEPALRLRMGATARAEAERRTWTRVFEDLFAGYRSCIPVEARIEPAKAEAFAPATVAV